VPPAPDLRAQIVTALAAFSAEPLPAAARGLFAALGYGSRRTLAVHSLAHLRQLLDPNQYLAPAR
jgi:hypothetical protein